MRHLPWRPVVVLAAVAALLPPILPPFWLNLLTEIAIMAIFAMSLGLIIGYAGLASLGHGAFFGIGAYTVALLGPHLGSLYLLVLVAVLLAGALAWLSGALFLRTSGAYFMMLTLAFCQVLYAVAFQWKPVTGGADGMRVTAVPDLGFATITDRPGLYYLMALAFLVAYALLRLFVDAPAGVITRGVMVNETRMQALGYDTRAYKLLTYTLAGAMAGLAGALYAYYSRYVTPDLTSWLLSGQAVIMVIVGGVGTLLGPALGAAFFLVLQDYISSFTERWPLIMGLVFVAFVLIGRGGLVHLLAPLGRRLVPRRPVGRGAPDGSPAAERAGAEGRHQEEQAR